MAYQHIAMLVAAAVGVCIFVYNKWTETPAGCHSYSTNEGSKNNTYSFTPSESYDNNRRKRRTTTSNERRSETCSICHEVLTGNYTTLYDCKHSFHSTCIQQWIIKSSRENNPPTCPNCRKSIN